MSLSNGESISFLRTTEPPPISRLALGVCPFYSFEKLLKRESMTMLPMRGNE